MGRIYCNGERFAYNAIYDGDVFNNYNLLCCRIGNKIVSPRLGNVNVIAAYPSYGFAGSSNKLPGSNSWRDGTETNPYLYNRPQKDDDPSSIASSAHIRSIVASKFTSIVPSDCLWTTSASFSSATRGEYNSNGSKFVKSGPPVNWLDTPTLNVNTNKLKNHLGISGNIAIFVKVFFIFAIPQTQRNMTFRDWKIGLNGNIQESISEEDFRSNFLCDLFDYSLSKRCDLFLGSHEFLLDGSVSAISERITPELVRPSRPYENEFLLRCHSAVAVIGAL